MIASELSLEADSKGCSLTYLAWSADTEQARRLGHCQSSRTGISLNVAD